MQSSNEVRTVVSGERFGQVKGEMEGEGQKNLLAPRDYTVLHRACCGSYTVMKIFMWTEFNFPFIVEWLVYVTYICRII
jgi:hypothetical protein